MFMRKVVLKILLSAMIALMAVDALSQTQTENYVMTIEPLTESTQAPQASIDMSRVTVRYLDGLGREKSTVQAGASRSACDVADYVTYDNHARIYAPLTGRFTTLDPLASKYPSLTPYNHCANNPLNALDPDGRKIIATSVEAQRTILNTLTPEDRAAVKFSSSGEIDFNVLNGHISQSANFSHLKELNDSHENIFVQMSTGHVGYINNEGNYKTTEMSYWGVEEDFYDLKFEYVSGVTTGETGRLGITLLPGKGKSGVNSPNENIYIIINGDLTELGAAEIYSHEANGHALLFIRTRDRDASRHKFETGKEEKIELSKMILDSRKETVKNFNM